MPKNKSPPSNTLAPIPIHGFSVPIIYQANTGAKTANNENYTYSKKD